MKRVLTILAVVLLATAAGCSKQQTNVGTQNQCTPQCSGKQCGADGCGGVCGSCAQGFACNDSIGVCACAPETDAELCDKAHYACGSLQTADRCGFARTVASCGNCSEGLECTQDLHTCECQAETEQAICARLNRQCGAVTATDTCGVERTVASCGTCDAPAECNTQGACECVGESEAILCLNAGFDCGSPQLTDKCGQSYPASSCGPCEEPKACQNFRCDYLAVPANDSCANARDLVFVADVARVNGTTRGASDDSTSKCADMAGAVDVAYKFTLDKAATIYATATATTPGATGIAIDVFDACDPQANEVVPCGAKNGAVAIAAKKDLGVGTYWLIVETLGTNVDFALELKRNPTPPANDLCATAVPMVWDDVKNTATITGDTFLAKDDYQSGCSLWTPHLTGGDLVYSFYLPYEAAVTATVTRDPTNTTFQPAVSIRRGCADADELVCSRDNVATVTLGQGTYYVFVDGLDGSAGPFTLTLERGMPIAGDGCGNPEPLAINTTTGIGTATGDLTQYTQSGESTCELPGLVSGYDKVYSLVLGAEKIVDITLARASQTSTLHPMVYLRSECSNPATELRCAAGTQGEDAVTGPTRLKAGTYYLWVDSTSRLNNGTFTLTVRTSDPVNAVAANDTCAGATNALALSATAPSMRVTGDTRDAFDDYSDACSSADALLTGPDLVYKVELAQAGTLFASVTRDAGTPAYQPAVYLRATCTLATTGEGAACDAADGATDAVAAVSKQLAAGTYYVIVDGANGTAGLFTLELFLDTTPAVPDSCIAAEVLDFDNNGIAHVVGDTSLTTNVGGGSCGSGAGAGTGSNQNPALAYMFSTPAVRDVSILVTPTAGLHPTVYVRSVCDDALTEVGCQYAASASPVSMTLPNLPQGSYVIWVGGDQGEGAFLMRVKVAPPAPLANDVCSGAQQITLPTAGTTLQLSGSTAAASDDLTGGCATGYYQMTGGDLVYKFTVSSATRVTATATPTATSPNFQPALYVRSVCETIGNDVCTFSQTPGAAATLTASLPVGDWYLVVDGLFGTSGDFDLAISQDSTAAFSGDGCGNAIALQFTSNGTGGQVADLVGDTSLATDDYDPMSCFNMGGPELVYTFTIAQDSLVDVAVGPTDVTSNFIAGLYLRTNCADKTTEVRCVNSFAPQTPIAARLSPLPAGTYYLFIEGGGAGPTNNGAFTGTVTVSSQPLPPANNLCTGAQTVVLPASGSSPVTITASTDMSINSYAGGCQTTQSTLDGPDIVYGFTVTADTQVFARLTPKPNSPNYMPALYIRRDCARTDEDVCKLQWGPGQPVALAASLKPGNYYLIVDGVSGSAGEFDLEISQNTTLYVDSDNCLNASALSFTAGTGGAQVATFSENLDPSRSPSALNDTDSCWTGGPDFVYSFLVGQESYVDVTIEPAPGSSYSPAFYVRKACYDVNSELSCRNAYLSQPESTRLFHLAQGTYFLWVDTGSGGTGVFNGTVTVTPMPTPPVNDTCSGAELLDVTSGYASVIAETGFAADDAIGSCGTGPSPDLVYKFNVASPVKVEVKVTRDSTTPNYFPVVYVRSTCASAAMSDELGCGQADWSGSAKATIPNAARGTYYVWVDGLQAAPNPDKPGPGKFTLEVTTSPAVPAPPVNDYCSGVVPLVFTGNVATVMGDTTNASADTVNRCISNKWPDVVYSFTLGAARKVSVAAQAGNGQMPAIEVRRACGSMNPADSILCQSPWVPGGRAALTVPTLEAGTYYVWVSTENSSATSAAFTLTVTLDTPDSRTPVNDQCSGAIALTKGTPVTGDSTYAINDYLKPPFSDVCIRMANTYINMTGPEVVYSYTPAREGPFTIRAVPAQGYLAQLWVTEGVCGEGANCVAMPFQFGGALRTTVYGHAGTTYYIGVDSIVLDANAPIKAGKFTLTIQ